ncbi:hypothetical protein SDC9_112927 [bioreactor metagenome]|uniref:Uncharacterized protein n=1 Tax=bioreactor metagenome TaxID=1076179 RepID=A0A645BS23_9ZZZZ
MVRIEGDFADVAESVLADFNIPEIIAVFRHITFKSVQVFDKIDVPPRAAELAISEAFQTVFLLIFYQFCDFFRFHFVQSGCVDFAGCKFQACFLQWFRA